MYTKVYKDFLGVDLTSEPSEVEDRRLHRILNMWRDYRSQEGAALETAPGFTRLEGFAGKINGIHYLPAGNGAEAKLLVHAGANLYAYDGKTSTQVYISDAPINDARSSSALFYGRLYITDGSHYFCVTNGETVKGNTPYKNGYVPLTYLNGKPYEQRNILTNEVKEEYIISDETTYYIHDPAADIRALYLDDEQIPVGVFDDAPYSEEKYGRNISYAAEDNTTLEIVAKTGGLNSTLGYVFKKGYLYYEEEPKDHPDAPWELVTKNIVYAEEIGVNGSSTGTYYHIINPKFDFDEKYFTAITMSGHKGSSLVIDSFVFETEFATAGDFRDILTGNPDFKASSLYTAAEAVNGCTIITEFDGRIFLSGNPKMPNTVFYTQRDLTGYNNPFYIGAYNYLNDGTGSTPITAMMSTATHLIVLKDDAPEGSQVYYHYGVDNPSTDSITADLQPRIYQRETGVAGIGCLGTAVNFLDDAVFLSKNGLEAVGKSQVNLERTLTHRSSYVDAGLRNEDMRKALSAEWMGYLVLLFPSGRMYLADSRLRTSHPYHGYQYEWYLWDDIGVYDGQKSRYYYTGETISVAGMTTAYDKEGYTESEVLNGSDDKGKFTYVVEDGYVYAVATDHEQIGGKFKAPTAILSAGDKLYFGCEDGSLCVFNTELENGFITNDSYTHNGRRYSTEVTTKSDNCGHTNIAKSTERHSLVVKSKAFPMVSAEVYVRTDRDDWRKVDDIYCASRFSFGAVDFTNFSFNTTLDTIERLRESEKRWTEKQISIRTECYKSPYGVISISYNYTNAGRIRRT